VGKYETRKPLGRFRQMWGILLKRNLQKYDGEMWVGFIWLKIWACGRFL
jgi:hypothetical protein